MRFFALRKKGREVFTYGTKRQSVVSDSALSFCPHLTFTGCFIIPRRFGVVKPSPRCGGGKCSRQASAADGSAKKREKNVSDRRRMASRLGKKRAFPLWKLRRRGSPDRKNGSAPRCALGNIRGGKRVAVRSPRAWGQGRFSAGFVQIDAFCPAPSRPDCRVVSRALRRWRFDPTAAAFLRLRADGVAPPACAPCPARLLS